MTEAVIPTETEARLVVTDSRFSVITKRGIIRSVPASFERQYGHDRSGSSWKAKTTRGEMIDALNALDVDTCDAEAVNAIIGNKSWTSNECDACGTDCEVLVRIGQEPDYEARWQDLCAQCLTDAAWVATTANSVGTKAREAGRSAPIPPVKTGEDGT